MRFPRSLLAVSALPLALAACTDAEPSVTGAAPASEAAAAASPGTPAASGAPAAEGTLTSVTLKVEGMVCEGCQNTIQGEVGKLAGVKSCTASHEAGEAKVEFDPTRVDRATIAAKISELGYKVADPG